MNIGEKLLDLRKKKGLSQEEAAESLGVSRQTISKWETNQTTPDFDKIIPICKLYDITTDELLTGTKVQKEDNTSKSGKFNLKKKAKGISLSILIYIIAVAWIMITIPVFKMNPIISSAIFLLICGLATFIIVYVCMVYKTKEKKCDTYEEALIKKINNIISLIVLVIYLFISFTTMAWHITWIIWIIYGLIEEVVKLIFMLRGINNEK